MTIKEVVQKLQLKNSTFIAGLNSNLYPSAFIIIGRLYMVFYWKFILKIYNKFDKSGIEIQEMIIFISIWMMARLAMKSFQSDNGNFFGKLTSYKTCCLFHIGALQIRYIYSRWNVNRKPYLAPALLRLFAMHKKE